MTKIDSPQLAAQLNALAEVFDKRPISPKALEVWFDTLKEFATEMVLGLLIGWPKSHGKFPAPSEVWKACNDMATAKREAIAKEEAQRARRPDFYPGVGGAQAEKFIAQMRATLNKPRWTPLQHWQHLFDTAQPGSIGHRYAEEVLRKKGVIMAREPGEDDEPKAINF